MSRAPPGPPPTLGDLVAVDMVISTWCQVCQSFGRQIEPAELVAFFGPDMLATALEGMLRCGRCGERQGEIRVTPRTVPFSKDWKDRR